MPYTVEFLKTAEEELAGLPKDAQRRIVRRIEGLKDDPRPPGAELLKGAAEKLWRVRVGDYRVIYSVESRHLVVLVIRIAHRRDVYDALKILVQRLVTWRGKRGGIAYIT